MGLPWVVLDTSVLINIIVVDRLDLPGSDPGHHFVITEHVREEITDEFPMEKARLERAISKGQIQQTRVDHPEELVLFAELLSEGRLGIGECSAMALAHHRDALLGMDDRRASLEAKNRGISVLGTQDLMIDWIRKSLLTVETADEIKRAWETEHRFRLPFHSFREEMDE